MSEQRDELRGTLASTICNASNYPREVSVHLWGRDMSEVLDKTADAILAAGYSKPRTITTVEELKTVYAGCLIRESGGDLWSIDGATDRLFMIVDGADDTYDNDILSLPATVLYEPTP